MKMQNLIDEWVNNTEKSIRNIQNMLNSIKDYEQDFVKLAKFIIETDINPWGFMPKGWEGVKESAQSFESFLNCLHHAMVDDGDVCFINVEIHGPHIAFIDKWDEERIKQSVETRFKQTIITFGIPEYTVHTDSNLFIEQLIAFETSWSERCARLDKFPRLKDEQLQKLKK